MKNSSGGRTLAWAWLQSEGVTEPALWRDRRWNSPNQPVVGVSFWEAEACSKWAGGRLPREEEWEAAPRGSGGSVYPWGNDWVDGISQYVGGWPGCYLAGRAVPWIAPS